MEIEVLRIPNKYASYLNIVVQFYSDYMIQLPSNTKFKLAVTSKFAAFIKNYWL